MAGTRPVLADLGKPVKTSKAGTVVRSAFDAGGYGNYIEIAHGEGWHTLYAHLQSRAVGVGARVSDSAQIGRVGGTGNVTGPHLHYEQIRDGVVVEARFGQSTWAQYPGPATYSRSSDC
jgi:murein DD-endopeptidase MepM/ murein hydrolase activator NlpD